MDKRLRIIAINLLKTSFIIIAFNLSAFLIELIFVDFGNFQLGFSNMVFSVNNESIGFQWGSLEFGFVFLAVFALFLYDSIKKGDFDLQEYLKIITHKENVENEN